MTSPLARGAQIAARRAMAAIKSDRTAYLGALAAMFGPFVIATAFILSLGPTLQTYALALFYADTASIYESLHHKALAPFPRLKDWLMAGINWRYLLLAAAIAGFSVRRSSPRMIAVSAGISSFASLCLLDAVSSAANQSWTLRYAVENLVMNLMGAITLSAIIMLLAVTYDLMFRAMQARPIIRRLVCAIPVATGGLILSAAVYYLSAFVYKPIPAKITAVLTAPVSGDAFYDPPEKSAAGQASEKDEAKAFQFLPFANKGSRLDWRSPQEAIHARWHRVNEAVTFNVSIELFADCFDKAIDDVKSIDTHVLRFPNVSNLNIQFDAGGSSLLTPASDPLDGDLRLQFERSAYWLDREADKGTKYTHFVDSDARVDLSSGSGTAFYLAAELFGGSETTITSSPRTLTIEVDGKSQSFTIEPAKRPISDKSLNCRSIVATKTSGDALGTHPTNVIGALVRILADPNAKTYARDSSQLTLSNGNGWITVRADGISEKMSGQPAGTLNFISFKGRLPLLTVDDRVLSTTDSDLFLAAGKFDLSYQKPTEVRLDGTTYAAWKNSERLSPTKFETLEDKTRFALIGTMGAALLWLAKFFVAIWRADKPLEATIPRGPTGS